FVIAVDVPSGLDVDNMAQLEVPLAADLTVTFGGLKPCHTVSPARELCGAVRVAPIGFSPEAEEDADGDYPAYIVRAAPEAFLGENPWSRLSANAHKFDRGHILVIGGSAGKSGAPIIAAMAALRT